MLIAKNDEEKRSRIWRYTTNIAMALIIIVAAYFIYKGFFGNPLEGKWVHDESDMILEIQKNDTAILTWDNLYDGQELTVKLNYSLDKAKKQITFKVLPDELTKAAEEVGAEASDVQTSIDAILTSFNYSVDGEELTLIEWDYGDQLLFSKLK